MESRSSFRVIGLDPGWAAFGWSILEIYDGGEASCIKAGVWRHKRNPKISKNLDAVERIRSIHEMVSNLATDECALVGTESMSWTRFATSDRGVAMYWGAAASAVANKAIVMTTPTDIKKFITGRKSANKTEVIDAACERIPGLRGHLGSIRAKTMHNHAADAAVAALIAGTKSDAGRITATAFGVKL